VGTGVRLERDAEAAGAEHVDIAPGGADGHPCIPLSVHDQDPQVAACLEPAERSEATRKPAVNRHNTSKTLG